MRTFVVHPFTEVTMRAMLSGRIWRMRNSMSLESIKQQVKAEISKLTQVLHLLEGTGMKPAKKQRHTMSAAARKRISQAQKARWAKAKGHAPKPKRTISAAGRNRIAAAQRARWAKIKAAKT